MSRGRLMFEIVPGVVNMKPFDRLFGKRRGSASAGGDAPTTSERPVSPEISRPVSPEIGQERSGVGTPPHPLHVPRWLPATTYVIVLIATVALLVLHTVEATGVRVDTTTLGLLAVLLLLPLAPY